MQWIGKQITRSKKKKRINLKKVRERSHKVILNILTAESKSITPKITTRNRNKIKKLKRKPKSQIKNESLNQKNIPKKNGIKPDNNLKRKLFLK
jgi:hypothetical protein